MKDLVSITIPSELLKDLTSIAKRTEEDVEEMIESVLTDFRDLINGI